MKERRPDLGLSDGQHRLWFMSQLARKRGLYQLGTYVRLRGPLETASFVSAFGDVIRRHEMLRSSFPRRDDGHAVRRVHSDECVRLSLEKAPSDIADGGPLAIAEGECRAPLDLETAPPVRARLIELASDDHLLTLVLHHLVCDEWSMGVIARDLSYAYANRLAGRLPGWGPAVIPASYVPRPEEIDADLAYWRRELASSREVLDLGSGRQRPVMPSYESNMFRRDVDRDLAMAVRRYGQLHGVTLTVMMLAALSIVVARRSDTRDVSIAVPTTGRATRDLETAVGFFVNPVVIRIRLVANPSFREIVERLRQALLDGLDHSGAPFGKVIEAVAPKRSISHLPFTQLSFSPRDADMFPLELARVECEVLEIPSGMSQYDLAASATAGDPMQITLEYATDLYDAAWAERVADSVVQVLDAGLRDDTVRLAAMPVLTEGEAQVLALSRGPSERFPDVTVDSLILAQPKVRPQAVCVVAPDGQLTYSEMARVAESVSGELHVRGVRPGDVVAVVVGRSTMLVPMIVGILNIGAAYLPLDEQAPEVRRLEIMDDAGVALLVHDGGYMKPDGWSGLELDAGSLRKTGPRLSVGPGGNWKRLPLGVHSPDALAYMIYTSGSTGRPKGALISHRAVANYLHWAAEAYELSDETVGLLHGSPAFDMSVTALLGPLTVGGCVEILPSGPLEIIKRLGRIEGRPLIKVTPSHLQILLETLSADHLRQVDQVIVGGEELRPSVAAAWLRKFPWVALVNEYGPTETAVACTAKTMSEVAEGPITIGLPIANTRVEVLDQDGNEQPVGCPGEISICGRGVGYGYRGRPIQTARQFVPDARSERPGSRAYRSGDQGRRLPNGELELLGRHDNQVSLRGYRIELGEIEAALASVPGISEAAAVLAGESSSSARLVAHIASDRGDRPLDGAVHQHLQHRLPRYMWPTALRWWDQLPLTSNGKIDRKALAAEGIPLPLTRGDQSGSRNRALATLRDIWTRVLGHSNFDDGDNFFDVGGHSLLLLDLQRHLEQSTLTSLSLVELFQFPTVAAMARRVDGTEPLDGLDMVSAPDASRPDRKQRLSAYATQRRRVGGR